MSITKFVFYIPASKKVLIKFNNYTISMIKYKYCTSKSILK